MFAAVSCWSTTESLFLTLENAQIPKFVFWFAVIGLYVLTAFCTKLALDSLNTNNYMEHRRLKFGLGLVGFIVLWLIFSMPTNAHTFFYKQMAKKTAIDELKYLESQFDNLTDTILYLDKYQNDWDAYYNSVHMALDQLKHEINDPHKLGFGDIAESKLANVEDLLKLRTGTIDRRGTHNNSLKERNMVCEYYDNVVKEHLDILYNQHLVKVRAYLATFKEKINDINPIRTEIKKRQAELNDPNFDRESVLVLSRKVIDKSYAILENTFPEDYHTNDEIYRSDRLIKVTKVWEDYFNHKFKNTDYTLWYWILLSIIVDLAAFAFFDIATRKDEFDL